MVSSQQPRYCGQSQATSHICTHTVLEVRLYELGWGWVIPFLSAYIWTLFTGITLCGARLLFVGVTPDVGKSSYDTSFGGRRIAGPVAGYGKHGLHNKPFSKQLMRASRWKTVIIHAHTFPLMDTKRCPLRSREERVQHALRDRMMSSCSYTLQKSLGPLFAVPPRRGTGIVAVVERTCSVYSSYLVPRGKIVVGTPCTSEVPHRDLPEGQGASTGQGLRRQFVVGLHTAPPPWVDEHKNTLTTRVFGKLRWPIYIFPRSGV